MNTNKQSAKRRRQDKNSSGVMRIFYVLMLVLMLSSSIIRIAGANRNAQSGAMLTPQVNSTGSGSTARAFVFHKVDSISGTCVDLVISAMGNAVYSNCGHGGEKQYDLNNSELLQLQKWIKQYQPVNYDHTDNALAGIVTTQLYLNGQGNQQASNVDTQHIIEFAIAMAAKVAMRP